MRATRRERLAMSGHKTISVLKRLNLVTEEELSQIKWPTQKAAEKEESDISQSNQGL